MIELKASIYTGLKFFDKQNFYYPMNEIFLSFKLHKTLWNKEFKDHCVKLNFTDLKYK